MHLFGRSWLPVLLVVLLALVSAQPALAHAQLLATVPVDGAVLAAAPQQVRLQFNEPVSPLAMTLIGPDGTSVDLLDETVGGESVAIDLPQAVASGTHVLSYRVVSTDGHPIGGAVVFSIGQVSQAAPAPGADLNTSVALWAGKALLFVALFFGVGGAAFRALAPLPRVARGIALGLAATGLVLAPMTLGLQGLDALGLPLPALFEAAPWNAGLATSYGATAIVAAVAFLAALGGLATPAARDAILLGLLAAGLAALSLALSGHASAAAPQWLTRPAVFVHAGGVLLWIGALLPLWLLLRDRSAAADAALARFSRSIPYAVAGLLLSGVTLATIQMGWPGPQWLTGYGVILAAKLLLLVALFGLALWNRRSLTAPALAGDSRARRRLRRSIAAEAGLVLLILGLVAGWRFTPPPRALALAPAPVASAEPVLLHLMDATTMAMAAIRPGKAGPVQLDLAITDIEGVPKAVQAVAVTLASPALGIEPIRRDAVATDTGWRVGDLTVPVAGTWRLELDIRVSRFELSKLEAEFSVP